MGEIGFMRVISGLARGRILLSPGVVNTRPTSEKVKEAIFSSLQGDLPEAVVLDLFSGSGQLGIEALSRGADFAYFAECERQNFDIVKKNVSSCGFGEKSKLFCLDARLFLKRVDTKFDIAFLDPPYGLGLLNEVLPLLHPLMNDDGIVICEHGGDGGEIEGASLENGTMSFSVKNSDNISENLPQKDTEKLYNFTVYRQKKYGKVHITMLIKS
jgi:16S rRNA (guanine(966)-N(2))-methyltransferase RsmD